MSRLVIIAGPQAAGKSTTITALQSQNVSSLLGCGKSPVIFPLQESRQITAHRHMLLGAIFMTLEQELEVVNCDLERMDFILERTQNQFLYVDECNIFTTAHAKAHGILELEQYWNQYITRLHRLDAVVIFLDVVPDISWERRRHKYEQRLIYFPENERETILERYRLYLTKLHPLLHEVYDRLPFPKAIIDGNSSEDYVLATACKQIANLL
ncbi:MAG TPA: hypothetical protein VJI96_00540 [Candidatus Andersenbacteria bacterium]|nr:hypothetical protein [Candidatus Andersenbacteria bacterium]